MDKKQPKLEELLKRVIERREEDFNSVIAKAHDNDDIEEEEGGIIATYNISKANFIEFPLERR